MRDGRLVLKIGGMWDWREVGGRLSKMVGDWSHKQVRDGMLIPLSHSDFMMVANCALCPAFLAVK